MRVGRTYSPPHLDMQDVQLDDNGEFHCMVSVIISPEEFYVHPIQESSGDLTKVERELDSLVQGDKGQRHGDHHHRSTSSELTMASGLSWTILPLAAMRVTVPADTGLSSSFTQTGSLLRG